MGPYLGQWYLVAVLSAILLTIPGLGEKHFSTRGEPREALVMDHMFSSGNLILPRGYAEAVPSKPPLMHWIAVIASYPGGSVTELTARLPSALAAIFFIIYFFRFTARRSSIPRALIASTIVMTSFEWWRSAVVARVDLLLSVLIAIGLLELYRWRERALSGIPLGAVLALSGATLTKGPVSLVLPGGIFGLYMLATGVPFFKAAGKTALVLLFACLVPSLWYLAAYRLEPEAFAAKFYEENIARFLGKMEEDAHKHSAFYLLGALGYGFLPWSVPGLLALCAAPFRIEEGRSMRQRFNSVGRLELFSAIAALAVLLFFSIPASKRSVYLLPAFPFLALLVSQLFERDSLWRVRGAERRMAMVFSGLIFSIAVFAIALISAAPIARFVAGFIGEQVGQVFEAGLKATPVFGSAIMLAVVAIAAAAVFIRAVKGRPFGFSFAVMWILFLASANIITTPFSNQLGNDRFAELVRPIVEAEPNTPIFSYGNEYYGASFYLKRQINHFDPTVPQPGFVIASFVMFEELRGQLAKGYAVERLVEAAYPDTKPGLFPELLRVSAVADAVGDGPAVKK